ncbi:virulence factor [Bacillus canaveralius]|uniref:Virulence factor n=1 Tax=Bacillus canaveralius TaxID=1403243 RepID=A0A2N5GJ63_9BACI|nr:conserved virulence factor C family protein [Bacillus canaveralius]PLR81095.1 virulence factor [Bacillus canaveralius]PLR99037.1 virulence factor [Bacillus canaveralius]
MKILAIEPTPSPNTMKIILDRELPMGQSNNYKKDHVEGAPDLIKSILNVEGVKGVYHVADFLAVERNAKYDWKQILPQVRKAFGEESSSDNEKNPVMNEHYGEIKVQVQIFKGIPMQVKLTDGAEEKRFGLPEVFLKALANVQNPSDNVVMERKWHDFGIRYGDFDQVGQEVVEELIASYPEERLNDLVKQAANPDKTCQVAAQRRKKLKLTADSLNDPDWRKRYQIFEQMEDPELADLPLLEKALGDEKASIRRLAVVYLGMIEDPQVLPLLYKALEDKSVTVRRTAGDCLSDLGFEQAMNKMADALQDSSKLVRWRAAMFLYEVGDESVLPALRAAQDDPEFEVSMQIKLAIARIEGGEAAKGSVWKQMTEARKQGEEHA